MFMNLILISGKSGLFKSRGYCEKTPNGWTLS